MTCHGAPASSLCDPIAQLGERHPAESGSRVRVTAANMAARNDQLWAIRDSSIGSLWPAVVLEQVVRVAEGEVLPGRVTLSRNPPAEWSKLSSDYPKHRQIFGGVRLNLCDREGAPLVAGRKGGEHMSEDPLQHVGRCQAPSIIRDRETRSQQRVPADIAGRRLLTDRNREYFRIDSLVIVLRVQ